MNPYILLVIATMFWGGNFVIGRGFSEVMSPFTLSLFRWIIAFVCLLPFGWKQLINNSSLWKKEWKPILLMSLTGITGFNTLVYIGLHYTTSINATLVNATAPAFITLLSFFLLRERLALPHYIGMSLSIFGVFWIISRGSIEAVLSLSFNRGELWIIVAVISWALYSILVKKHAYKFPGYGLFQLKILLGIIVLFPFGVYEWIFVQPVQITFKTGIGLLYLGLCASIISFICWNKAVAELGPGKASPFLNLIPLFASVSAILFLDEKLYTSQMIGAFFILVGVFITTGVFKIKIPRKKQKASS